MNSTELVKAIKYLRPSAEFSFTNDDYSTIKWDVLEGEAPTLKELEAASVLVAKAEAEAEAAAKARKQEILDRLGITEEEARLLLG